VVDVQVGTARSAEDAERARLDWAAAVVAADQAGRFGVAVQRTSSTRWQVLVGPHDESVSDMAVKRAVTKIRAAMNGHHDG
jgi:hypothetical protein